MKRGVASVVVWGLSVAWATQAPRAQQAPPAAAAGPALKATVDTYCVTCHNQRLKTGGLSLDNVGLADAAAHADVWEKVVRKVRGGMMPPAGAPRPAAEARTALVSFLETTLDRAALASPNPGRPLAHRLNRTHPMLRLQILHLPRPNPMLPGASPTRRQRPLHQLRRQPLRRRQFALTPRIQHINQMEIPIPHMPH